MLWDIIFRIIVLKCFKKNSSHIVIYKLNNYERTARNAYPNDNRVNLRYNQRD